MGLFYRTYVVKIDPKYHIVTYNGFACIITIEFISYCSIVSTQKVSTNTLALISVEKG